MFLLRKGADIMPQVINCGHRGAMAYEPENTLRSFRRAAEMGANQIELDVFLTADRVPVIIHSSILHTQPHGGKVHRMKWDEVRELRFRGEPIPTLQQSIDLVLETGMKINIEIKDRSAVEITADTVKKNNLYDKCQISNFHIGILKHVKKIDSKIPTGYLSIPYLHWHQLKLAAALECESINPMHSCVTQKYVEEAHRRGVQVHVWTVNKPEDMRRMILLGVDCIITNVPDVLARMKTKMGVD
jgi:glycerophosphoryl diester phosphodiesterase